MKATTRRVFLGQTLGAGFALAMPGIAFRSEGQPASGTANDVIQIGVIGLGGMNVVGGVGGRGRQLMGTLRKIKNARVVALCDVDQAILDHEAQLFRDRGEEVSTYRDIRSLLEDKNVHAVAIATPNHWHALATVWACQAGKDVYVEKPFSYNIWEGRQMVAAARKYQRIVQVGTQSRSSTVLPQAFEYLNGGALGRVRLAHALVYRPRQGIGTVNGPTPVPATVDFDLWCGPAPKTPLLRKQLHYEWHWFWETGNGELGNNGVHVIDLCRWGLGAKAPLRAMSFGGRFAMNDAAETPNTHVAYFEFERTPIICEVRNVRASEDAFSKGKFKGRSGGIVIECDGGYLAGDATKVAAYDKEDRQIREFRAEDRASDVEVAHFTNFFSAMRSRKPSELAAEALEGHHSTMCCHMGNTSYRLGAEAGEETIRERLKSNDALADAYERCREHLTANGVDLGNKPLVLGPWLTLNAETNEFTGNLAAKANALSRRAGREPFVVPEIKG